MLQPEHEAELNSFPRTPVMKIAYALGMLADVVERYGGRREGYPRHGRQGDYHYRPEEMTKTEA